MARSKQIFSETFFTPADIRAIREEPSLSNQSRRNFLKWGVALTSRAILGGGVINLLAGYRILIPLSGMTLSTLFVPEEQPGLGIFIGGALIIGALIFTNRMERRSPEVAIDIR